MNASVFAEFCFSREGWSYGNRQWAQLTIDRGFICLFIKNFNRVMISVLWQKFKRKL